MAKSEWRKANGERRTELGCSKGKVRYGKVIYEVWDYFYNLLGRSRGRGRGLLYGSEIEGA